MCKRIWKLANLKKERLYLANPYPVFRTAQGKWPWELWKSQSFQPSNGPVIGTYQAGCCRDEIRWCQRKAWNSVTSKHVYLHNLFLASRCSQLSNKRRSRSMMDTLNPELTKFSESQPVLNAWQCEIGGRSGSCSHCPLYDNANGHQCIVQRSERFPEGDWKSLGKSQGIDAFFNN